MSGGEKKEGKRERTRCEKKRMVRGMSKQTADLSFFHYKSEKFLMLE